MTLKAVRLVVGKLENERRERREEEGEGRTL
jgi:hypothetical protein